MTSSELAEDRRRGLALEQELKDPHDALEIVVAEARGTLTR